VLIVVIVYMLDGVDCNEHHVQPNVAANVAANVAGEVVVMA
jgi:hypothetical protein